MKNINNSLSAFAAALALLWTPYPVNADSVYSAYSSIDGRALSGANGAVAVNLAAGDGNLQSNDRAVAITRSGGLALAQTLSLQSHQGLRADLPEVAAAHISGQAFNNATGLISINQTGGVGNRQSNAFAAAMSISGKLDDAALAATLPAASTAWSGGTEPSRSRRSIRVGQTAFAGSRGIVQINQATGRDNISANRVEISIMPNS